MAHEGERAHAVELRLEDPALARERLRDGGRQHGTELLCIEEGGLARVGVGRAARTVARERRHPSLLEVTDRQAADHGAILLEHIARRDELIAVLDQEPRLGVFRDADERPGAVELLAAKEERCLAGCDLRQHAAAAFRLVAPGEDAAFVGGVRAAIPDDDLTGAVIAFRDDALEAAVVEGVVLDVGGHALVLRVQGGAARHRPRDEDAIDFEAEVPVHAGGGVLLDNEREVAGVGRGAALGLRGGVEAPLLAVMQKLVEVRGGLLGHDSLSDGRAGAANPNRAGCSPPDLRAGTVLSPATRRERTGLETCPYGGSTR